MDLTRWRNSHGFGVHSPLGYDVARRVVNIGRNYAYYAERDILREAKKCNLSHSVALHCIKIHRLASLLQIHKAFFDTKPDRCIQTALTKAGIKISQIKASDFSESKQSYLCPDASRSLFLLRHSYPDEVYNRLLSTAGNTIILYSPSPSEAAMQLKQTLESGIVIEGNDCALAIVKEQTQPIGYRMNF